MAAVGLVALVAAAALDITGRIAEVGPARFTLYQVLAVVLTLLALWQLATKRAALPKTPVTLPLAAFLGTAALSLVFATELAPAVVQLASLASSAVLVLIVVVGAPFVEELLYRGLLQGAFSRRIDDVLAVVVVAAWFALSHFRHVEYVGLFVVGLVIGVCALVTRRIGMSIVAHMAFNATGLVWVATR